MARYWWLCLPLVVSACLPANREAVPGNAPVEAVAVTSELVARSSSTITTTTTQPAPTTTEPPTTTTTEPRFVLEGSIAAPDGSPVAGATVSIAGQAVAVDEHGRFLVRNLPAGDLVVSRPAWESQTIGWDGSGPVDVVLEPRVVRAVRVSRYVAMDPDSFAALLEQIAGTAINTLIFDTKDEGGTTLYRSQVPTALEVGAVRDVYDPATYLEQAKARDLYTITRIVSFEDGVWTRSLPEAKLAGSWVDARDQRNWEYPLGLAVEACELGFDEVQFDYVRFPTGRASVQAQRSDPTTEDERVATITAFLAEARDRLHPLGCALSAAIFGIVLSSPDDQGIGQRPEEVSTVVDAVSPMVYPSHYSPGWLGFADPNDHPGPVTADALDAGEPRLTGTAVLRPWLQAFYYNGNQVKAGIFAAEARGHGWLLWNAGGEYGDSWLPTLEELPEPAMLDRDGDDEVLEGVPVDGDASPGGETGDEEMEEGAGPEA